VYKGEPRIAYDRIEEISGRTGIALALHGGTGLSDDVFRKCISLGCAKVNISTQLKYAFIDGFVTYHTRNNTEYNPLKVIKAQFEELKRGIIDKIKLFGGSRSQKEGNVPAAKEVKGGSTGTQTLSASTRQAGLKAVIFDCDGVLADTERDGHRVAFNRAFAEKGLDIEWDVALYGELLKVAGGKERMRHYFDSTGWPDEVDDKDVFIKELHKLKTDSYMKIIESGELPLRPGVARLVDEAIAEKITLAVCSTSNERAVNLVVGRLLGSTRESHFAAILAGDVVSKKKPDPEIYNLALQQLQLDPRQCIVIEDSRNGLLAAKAAGMYCVVTTNGYTEDEDLAQADLVVPELGDPPNVKITVQALRDIVEGR
jgi:HAD superfamily hydrolase (TIGR01509 family)